MRRRNCDIYGALGSYRHICGAGDFSVVVEHDMSSTISPADTYVLASLSPYDYCRTAIWGITFGVSEQRSRTNDSLWFLIEEYCQESVAFLLVRLRCAHRRRSAVWGTSVFRAAAGKVVPVAGEMVCDARFCSGNGPKYSYRILSNICLH